MFTKNIYLYITIISFAFIPNCFAVSDLPYVEGELLIRFAPKTQGLQRTIREKNQFLSSLNAGEIKQSFKKVSGLTLVKLPQDHNVATALAKFQGKVEILYVEPNYKYKLCSTFPDDPCFPKQWSMHNTGQTGGTVDADIDAPEAWDIIHDACDIIVAVIDSGIDRTHPDLVANMLWVNEAELYGFPGVDDDNNGYVDDIYGYDFYYNDEDPTDYMGHGTHVAGIVGAAGNNNEGVAGVCWNVKLMNLKIGADNSPTVSVGAAITAIDYAIDKGAKILNNSWGGGPYSQSLKDAIEAAGANGVLFIAAAGNGTWDDRPINIDTSPFYPASYTCDNIISVLATNHNDGKISWSNYGVVSVDLGAPGEDILSCYQNEYYPYQYLSGTSMAAPHVAGACALVWAVNPLLTHLQAKEAILNSVDALTSLSGKCVTGGRLNLYNAVSYWPLETITLTNTDDANSCIPPSSQIFDSYVNYTIAYSTTSDMDDVNIVDTLPDYANFDYASHNGIYDSNFHTVTWNLGDIDANDSNSFTIRVRVSEDAIQGTALVNTVKMYYGNRVIKTAIEATQVCCMNPVIYVDKDAGGANDGTSWEDAYTDLQVALENARDLYCCADQIWVAAGAYYPTDDPYESSATFQMVGGVDMYGHFAGWETSINQRSLANPEYETILSGDINDDQMSDVSIVVTGANADINGFTITGGFKGIFRQSCNYANQISHCIIKNNDNSGIHCWLGSIVIANNIISGSENGICLSGVQSAEIRNNTIVKNDYGINGADPNVSSNIIYGNQWGFYSEENPFTKVNYNCIQNYYYGGGIGNIINQNPQFRDYANNDYHLTENSPCINAGNPNFESSETDIDGESRVNGRVDIGADEFYYCSGRVDIFPASPDGIVNSLDFVVIADAWLTEYPNANFNSIVDFDGNGSIDIQDLKQLCDCWLWTTNFYEPVDNGYLAAGFIGDSETMAVEQTVIFEEVAVQIEPQVVEAEPVVVDVNELLDWLGDLWETDEEIRSSMSEEEYLEFRKSIEESEE